jgi:hypothetical protein
MIDFDFRCAYSMQHSKRVGDDGLQVDHFNPTKKNDPIQEYTNLFPAIVHCNNRKSEYWPKTIAEYDAGKRILNPRRELDYNEQLVEIRETGELIGLTAAARFHILKLDLNVPFLSNERRNRTQHLELTDAIDKDSSVLPRRVADLSTNLKEETNFMIPPVRSATASEIMVARGPIKAMVHE